MKRTSILLVLVLFAASLFAQPGRPGGAPHNVELKVRARAGERFIVSIDGQRQQGAATNAYIFSGLRPGKHDLAVELTRPAHATLRTSVDLRAAKEEYVVIWRATGYGTELVVEPAGLSTYAPSTPTYQPPMTVVPPTGRTGSYRDGYQDGYRDGWRDAMNSMMQPPMGGGVVVPPSAVAVEQIPVATPEEVNRMVSQLRSENFDNNRSELAQAMVASKLLTTADIKRLMSTFTFEDNKLDFAKFAYNYVLDPENYFQVASGFTFSTNKTELLNYIKAHQR